MAGMLPGVECARRRRFHQSGSSSDSPSPSGHGLTRRSSFCLYTISKHESHLSSSSSLQRSKVRQAYQDEKLGGVAREAKERLDERLKPQYSKSETKRKNSQESMRGNVEGRSMVLGDLQTEVFALKTRGTKRFSWAKLGWKASDQEECAVCLEEFKAGETLVHLPCAHRFHSRCLVPWLESNAHCPCCRMGILI
ncbi:hypothetical protein F0562_009347 [Nyssa sinensis]|uniref:RING-type domain-containing protein n=1 Tax=Nyssa sinensis TaxID=561372 RepID=A0A5J4ZYD9_9ASTE|nr:hypothetical protein F0562_009347 [Nyssa sinensis]